MEFNFLKKQKSNNKRKNENSFNKLILEDNIKQVENFFCENENVNYEDTLMTMLQSMDIEELEKVFIKIYSNNNDKYEKLLTAYKTLSYPSMFEIPLYRFETKIEKTFSENYNQAKLNLSTGDLVAFLVRYYIKFSKKVDKPIEPAVKSVFLKIVVSLKENIPLLRTEIDNQLNLPISKALFVFFLYNKKEAFNKFKSILRNDLKNKDPKLFQLEYLQTTNRFFNRINLEYIPEINTCAEIYDVALADEKSSVTKIEIYEVVDKADFFNVKIPLKYFDPKKLINPNTNIKNIKLFTRTLSTIFNLYKPKSYFHKEDMGEVFTENITQPFPKYSDEVLIGTRETLKKMFTENQEFTELFFLYLYVAQEREEIKGFVNKLPELLSYYLGGLSGYSQSKIKTYFIHTDDNKIISKQKTLNDFRDRYNLNT